MTDEIDKLLAEVDYAVTTAREYAIPGCATPSTADIGVEIARDEYVKYLTDEDINALGERGVDVKSLTPDRTNESYRKLFDSGNGTYFVVADFGNARFEAFLLDNRAQRVITQVLKRAARIERLRLFFKGVYDYLWRVTFYLKLRKTLRRGR
jgi:hypothetical protein